MIKPRVLVIDDDWGDSPALQEDFVNKVDPAGQCEFFFCSGQEEGTNSLAKIITYVESGWPHSATRADAAWALVLLDVAFFEKRKRAANGEWGFDVLAALRERWTDLPVVMLTSETAAKKTKANWAQADGFLPKPGKDDSDATRLFLTKLYSFGLFPDLREGARLAGASLPTLKVLQEARRFACDPLGSGRILYGETGTGKTELARFIHDEMRLIAGRSGAFRTWSAVAGTDENIVKSALFGQWEGAHSKADTHEPGEIEKAEGGTFFLDEVASLPAPVQALFMESRRRNAQLRRLVSRMGSFPTTKAGVLTAKASIVPGEIHLQADHRIAVDVVMLTASNVNLHDEEVADALGFRRDLLNDLGAPLYVPPLNERREDIPEIFNHIVRQIVSYLGRREKRVDDRVLSELQARDWTRKNVVALRQIAEHAVIAARDFDEILVRHLPPPIDLPRWAGDRPPLHGNESSAISVAPTAPDRTARTLPELSSLLNEFEVPVDPANLQESLPALQQSYARLVLKLFAAALRATRDRRGETSSLRAICKLLGVQDLRGSPQTYAAYDVVLRLIGLCDTHFEGLTAERCELLSDDPDVLERVQQAIMQRRRPKKKAST